MLITLCERRMSISTRSGLGSRRAHGHAGQERGEGMRGGEGVYWGAFEHPEKLLHQPRHNGDNEPGLVQDAVAGESRSSAPGQALEERHGNGGGMAEGRSEVTRDGDAMQAGPSRQTNEGRPNATPGATRTPGGTIDGASAQNNARDVERRHPTPTRGDATGIRNAANSQPIGQDDQRAPGGNGNPFLQPVGTMMNPVQNMRGSNAPRAEEGQNPPETNDQSGRMYPGPAPPRRASTGKKNMKASAEETRM
ncbi:hypothetical protein FB45DRAFT_868890 [Roridomyces roridus]|uniref:Uncharacterized protein n=1 Tax=Roridomyces roridus TaxID=1738132 RepID=A0AAD7BN07_9AGAR|nr:hypothetical protein FB45DRAFT_868890 [Roridomyces roridus]